MRFVLIDKFCEMSGYCEVAVHLKIGYGEWRQGHEYHISPDGRIHIDLDGFEKWVIE